MVGWSALANTVPLYALYALLFADTGLSDAQVSVLFAIWSAVGVLAEVPTGALADRSSRRGCLVAAGILQATGYAGWVLLPGFPGFAAGFVLWGLGGVLVSGAQEALLHDALVDVGAPQEYARISGWVTAAELVAQLPAAAAATILFSVGGYALAGWVSVGVCLAGSVAALLLPEPPRVGDEPDGDLGYLATLRAGLVEAAVRPGVGPVVLAAALLGGFDAVEEYFPLILADWGVPTAVVPLADLPIILAGVAGAALAGGANRWRRGTLALVVGAAMLLFGAAGIVGHPAGIAAVAVFYGLYRMSLVVVDARLQERILSRSRATVTSVAGIGTDLAAFAIYAGWALGGVPVIAGVGLLTAVALPSLLRPPLLPGRRATAPPPRPSPAMGTSDGRPY